MVEQSRGHQMIESLLMKPSKKPDFKAGISQLLQQSNSTLTKVKAFMPEFVATTDRLINDPNYNASARMDITIKE